MCAVFVLSGTAAGGWSSRLRVVVFSKRKKNEMKLVELTKTCSAYPEQYEGLTECGKHIYIRHRYGWTQVGCGPTMSDAIGPYRDEDPGELLTQWEDDCESGWLPPGRLPLLLAAAGLDLSEYVAGQVREWTAPAVAEENEEARQKVVAFLNEHTEPDPERPGLLRITGPFPSGEEEVERAAAVVRNQEEERNG